jgi:hypothetical protein
MSYQDRKAEGAWNDPPAVMESKKSKPPPPTVSFHLPILFDAGDFLFSLFIINDVR